MSLLLRSSTLASIAERRYGLLTTVDLLGAGVGRREIGRWVADGRLVREARSVYRVAGCPTSVEGSIAAAILVHGDGTWASHRTAAWLAGLPGFGRPGRVELTRLATASAARSAALVHRTSLLPPHHVTTVRGLPSTTVARTLFDLAGDVGELLLRRAVEVALRGRSCTIGGLYRVTEELSGRGRSGSTTMRAVLAERGRGYVPTESELDLLGRAVVAGIPGIEWQVEVSDEQGYIRRVDGFHRGGGLVIEWDGASFHDSPEQRALDDANDRRLRALGLEVLRYRWPHVTRRGPALRAEVLRLLAANGVGLPA